MAFKHLNINRFILFYFKSAIIQTVTALVNKSSIHKNKITVVFIMVAYNRAESIFICRSYRHFPGVSPLQRQLT